MRPETVKLTGIARRLEGGGGGQFNWIQINLNYNMQYAIV